MIFAALLLALTAVAEDPSGPAAEPTDEAADDTDAESEDVAVVHVWGRRVVEQARDELIEAAEAEGYVRERRREDLTILRHDSPWKGEIHVHDDGRVEVARQPVRFEPPFRNVTPASYLACILLPLCIRPGGQLVGPRKFHAQERRALEAIEPSAMRFNDRLADYAIDRKADATADRLYALWLDGTPIDGGPVIDGWEARRAAILAYWDSRTDNEWGDQIRAAIEGFVIGEIQQGAHPYTQAELDSFDRTRRSTRVFPSLSSPPPPPSSGPTPEGGAAPTPPPAP